MAGRFFGNTGRLLREEPVAEACFFMYSYMLDVTEFRSGARKSMDEYLTEPIEVLIAQSQAKRDEEMETTPFKERVAQLSMSFDDFEAEMGLTREPETVE